MPLDPQLQALQTSLNNAISNGQLALSAQTMGTGSAPVVALFQQAFGLAMITIACTIRIVPNSVNDSLTVSGAGVTTLFNVGGTTISIVFTSATPTTLDATGTIAPPAAANWK